MARIISRPIGIAEFAAKEAAKHERIAQLRRLLPDTLLQAAQRTSRVRGGFTEKTPKTDLIRAVLDAEGHFSHHRHANSDAVEEEHRKLSPAARRHLVTVGQSASEAASRSESENTMGRHHSDAKQLVEEMKRKGASDWEAANAADEYTRKAMRAQREGRLDEAADLHRASSIVAKHAAEQFAAGGESEQASRYRYEAEDSAKAATKMEEESERKRKERAPEAAKPTAKAAGLKAFAEQGGEAAAKPAPKPEVKPEVKPSTRTPAAGEETSAAKSLKAIDLSKKAKETGLAEDHKAAAVAHAVASGAAALTEGGKAAAEYHQKQAQHHADEEQRATKGAAKVEEAPKPAVAEAKPKGSVNAGLVAWRERRAALATAGKDAESTGKAADKMSRAAKDEAGHKEAARFHDAAHALHNAAREAAEKAGDQKKALYHAGSAQQHRLTAENHRNRIIGDKIAAGTASPYRAGGPQAAKIGQGEKAAKLKAFADEKKKQLGMVQRGKKGGLFVVTKGGKKSYVGKK